MKMDAKSGKLKIESVSESANGTAISAIQGAQNNIPRIAPKGALKKLH